MRRKNDVIGAASKVKPQAAPDTSASERMRTELLTLLSHELRGPLGAITAAADVLDAVPADSDTAAEARGIIARQARNLAHLLDDLRLRASARPFLPPPAPASGDLGAWATSRGRLVLVIEADGDALAALQSDLESDGHRVSTAADAVLGLQQLLEQSPDVSIVGLPGMAGRELARQARAAGYAGRMIASPGLAAHCTSHDLRAAGFDASLHEPVDLAQLRTSLSDH